MLGDVFVHIGIQEEIKLRGCEEPKLLVPSKDLLAIYELIQDFDMDSISYKSESLRSVLKKARKFFYRYYEVHKVPYEFYRKTSSHEFSFESEISPFHLPIKRVDEDVYYGCLGEVLICGEPVRSVYRRVELPNEITEVSTLSYVHEITHSQVNRVFGSIKNYNNMEILSIFNELLCASSMNDGGRLSYVNDVVRLHNLRYGIQFLQDGLDRQEELYGMLLEGNSYVESTLKAYNLFIDYLEGEQRMKDYIILLIQKVFDGDICVEQCLEALDITYENSLNVKRLERYLKR